MSGYEVKLVPPKQLVPPDEIKLCATRRVIRAAGVVEWADYIRGLEEAAADLAQQPTRAMVAMTERVVSYQDQFMRDAGNALRVMWRIRRLELETPPPATEQGSSQRVSAFEMSQQLKRGYDVILGCTACNSGFGPSPDICAIDDSAVRARFQAGQLGQAALPPTTDPAS